MRRFSLDSLITRLEKFVACPWLVLEYLFFLLLLFFFSVIILLCFMAVIFYAGLSLKKKNFGGEKNKEYMKGDSLKKFLVLKDGANFFLKN